MTNSAPRTVLVIGLPRTGKTTFLAAFWDVVSSGEVPTSLQLDLLNGDKHHLNEIRNLWADCNEIPRTRIADECTVSMTLRDPTTGTVSELCFPDMDGESFERQWTERTWSEPYAALVGQATGALLFVHPEKVKEAPLILDAQRLMKPLLNKATPALPPDAGDQASFRDTLPAEPTYAATQVQLVELVQFVQGAKLGTERFRLCVLVSAWDLVQKHGVGNPEHWLKRRLPLLHQYLVANADAMPFTVYGVSAQGGELADASQLLSLAK